MVRVANPYKLEAYKHASFESGEVWYLRASKSDEDDDQIEALARTYVVKNLNENEVAAAAAKGQDVRLVITKYVEPEVKMSSQRAALVHMTDHWTLKYPSDYQTVEKDEAGKVVLNEDGTPKLAPSPLAGTEMPVTPESMGLLQGITSDAYWHMSEVWAADGRTEKQEAEFPGDVLRLPEDRGGQASKKRKAVSA